MATIGDRNKDAFEKLKASLPADRPVMGLVVPANGSSVHVDLAKGKDRTAIIVMPKIDEAQVVGECLEWLAKKGLFLNAVDTLKLQQQFFAERDTEC